MEPGIMYGSAEREALIDRLVKEDGLMTFFEVVRHVRLPRPSVERMLRDMERENVLSWKAGVVRLRLGFMIKLAIATVRSGVIWYDQERSMGHRMGARDRSDDAL